MLAPLNTSRLDILRDTVSGSHAELPLWQEQRKMLKVEGQVHPTPRHTGQFPANAEIQGPRSSAEPVGEGCSAHGVSPKRFTEAYFPTAPPIAQRSHKHWVISATPDRCGSFYILAPEYPLASRKNFRHIGLKGGAFGVIGAAASVRLGQLFRLRETQFGLGKRIRWCY